MLDPVKLCCGRKTSEHIGHTCPDGNTMCCLCFGRFPNEQLFTDPKGITWDVCIPCETHEPPPCDP